MLTTLGLVILQVTLGLFGHESAYFGMLHGINALVLFSVAVMAGKRVRTDATTGDHAAERRIGVQLDPTRLADA